MPKSDRTFNIKGRSVPSEDHTREQHSEVPCSLHRCCTPEQRVAALTTALARANKLTFGGMLASTPSAALQQPHPICMCKVGIVCYTAVFPREVFR